MLPTPDISRVGHTEHGQTADFSLTAALCAGEVPSVFSPPPAGGSSNVVMRYRAFNCPPIRCQIGGNRNRSLGPGQPERRSALLTGLVTGLVGKDGEQLSLSRKSMLPSRSKDHFLVARSALSEDNEVAEGVPCLKHGWIGTGPLVAGLGKEIPAYKLGRQAAIISSRTTALPLSMLAAGMGLMTRSSIWEMWAETSQ